MSDWLTGLINSGALPALERLGAFTEERQKVIANNIANIDTPDFRPADLSLALFQESLREAVEATGGRPVGSLELNDTGQTWTDEHGRLRVSPQVIDGNNTMFHDGSTRNIETEMARMAKNGLLHRVVLELLRKQQTMLKNAIRSGGGGSAQG
jgi:flagellar basal-body rod protein FlgB